MSERLRIAIYIRVSTEDQTKEGYSLEVQKEYLESFAMREGYSVFKVYCDDGISAYSTRRPALKELFKEVEKKYAVLNYDFQTVAWYHTLLSAKLQRALAGFHEPACDGEFALYDAVAQFEICKKAIS